MEIRALSASDAAQCQALRLQALRECPTAFSSSYEDECDTPLSEVEQRLAPSTDLMVFGAFEGPRLVGTVTLHRWVKRKLAHKAVVWGMYVDPGFRNQGIGRQLIDRLLEHAALMPGLQRVTLGVNATNLGAIALYEAAGFRSFGGEPEFLLVDGALQDEIQMAYVIAAT
jgi:RimJ/RimL family protein N-acetyltransferase